MLTNDLRHALDPAIFATEALGLALDPWQREVLQSTGKRDLLNCSRQAGKSTTAAVLGLHASLYRPGSLTLLVSPSLRQSSELFRKVTDLRALLPSQPELLEDNKLSMSVKGGGRVVSLPGSEQTIRGFSGASLIVLDEAARVEDQLYYAVRPMLATSNGRLVGMSTPFGKRGWYWHEWSQGASWRKVQIPASQVPRISPAFLEEEKQTMGSFWYQQEYLCMFQQSTDSFFDHEDIHACLTADLVSPFGDEDVYFKKH